MRNNALIVGDKIAKQVTAKKAEEKLVEAQKDGERRLNEWCDGKDLSSCRRMDVL